MSTSEVFSNEIVKFLKGEYKIFDEPSEEDPKNNNHYYLIDHRKDDKIEIREIIN